MNVIKPTEVLLNKFIRPQKPITKKGTVKVDACESTPVVWKDMLLRLDVTDRNQGDKLRGQFFDYFTDKPIGNPMGFKMMFHSAYEENGIMYVIATDRTSPNKLLIYESDDLMNWKETEIFTAPDGWKLYNTSICSTPDNYIISVEVGGSAKEIGIGFTIFYLKASKTNIYKWSLIDPDKAVYTPERYSACPCIRWVDGYFYIIYLEELPMWCFAPYIVRTKDLVNYEMGLMNPIIAPSYEDKLEAIPGHLTDSEIQYIKETPDINNSDIDICEYHGKTYITYSWGIQLGKEFLAHAEYDGSMKEFLESFFD